MARILQGSRVVVIGGSSGVGLAVARLALAEGASVVIGSSNRTKVSNAVLGLGGSSKGVTVDVSDDASTSAFFESTGSFDHLVFTAGDAGPVLSPTMPAEYDLNTAGNLLRIRFWGAVRAIKYADPHLTEAGSITLTDGIMSRRPRKGLALAGAASGAIEHLVQGLAVDLAPRRVNTVCLGFTLTEEHAQNMSQEKIEHAIGNQLLKRPGTPDEVAEAYLYSMRSTYTTGQTLLVDGGRTLA